jgi:hypothetical protein
MEYKKIKNQLKDYNQQEVDVFTAYLYDLENEEKNNQKVNYWLKNINEEQLVAAFKKVAMDNLFIDGDTITIQWRKKLLISYNYQAYKNKVLNAYPKTTFDVQLVHQDDSFSFSKKSGKVVYSHDFGDPFKVPKTIIGCYCIIKNSRGEFIEILDMDDISKMRKVATTQFIWNTWEGEMIYKSVMKRACKRHFKDLVLNIENIDNQNYDLTNVSIDVKIQTKIEECQTENDLNVLYNEEKENVEDEVNFVKLLTERKKVLIEELKIQE